MKVSNPHKSQTLICARQDALDAELRAELEARAGELARAAPNLKAVDQFEAVRVRLPQRHMMGT